jgi:hypothetical protein
MREGSKWLRLLVIGLLACTLALAGCSGDDGDDGIAGTDGQDFQLPAAEQAGLLACSTCHGTSTAASEWVESKHAMNSDHTIDACATCHNPSGAMYDMQAAFGVSPTGTVVGCEDCHGAGSNHVNLPNGETVANTAPGTEVCAQCHDGDQHASRHVFASEIASRFGTSRHANQHARTGFCSACHSHEGGVLLLSQERFTDIEDFAGFYNSTNVPHFNLPEAEEGVEGVNGKQCATCHDPHKAALRGQGDVVGSFTWDDDADPITDDVTEEAVVFSAEFNLCTACHMVDLDATPAGHGDAGLLLSYELSDKYLKDNLVDAATGTWKEVDIDGRGLTKVANVFYHDGTSANNRHFVDTHFGGTMYSSLYYIGAADTQLADIEVKGYNINAANPNACTVCHDPHTGGKMLAPAEPENNDNSAIGFAEGLGDFHTNHLGAAQGHGCTPCHSGTAFVPLTTRGVADTEPKTSVIGCRSCHDLAVPNSTPNTNDAAAFAQVREFQPGYEFKFNSGATVDVAELGVNQICFECHKGRTAGLTHENYNAQVAANTYTWKDNKGTSDTSDDETITELGTLNYAISYLHYAPAFATLFGDESKMVATYEGNTYAGRFLHPFAINGVQEFGCVDCHNVHDTDGNNVAENKMVTSTSCSGCHAETGAYPSVEFLQDRTQAYSEALLGTILDVMLTYVPNAADYDQRAGQLGPFLVALGAEADPAVQEEMLAEYIETRQVGFPTAAIAKAATSWKVFTYEDGAPHGQVHGHGGSWAHNSKFARQVMYDAIKDLDPAFATLGRP